jgi:hypothetical protein
MLGRKQKAESRKQNGERIVGFDISHLTAGIYFIKIETDKGFITKKIVKM